MNIHMRSENSPRNAGSYQASQAPAADGLSAAQTPGRTQSAAASGSGSSGPLFDPRRGDASANLVSAWPWLLALTLVGIGLRWLMLLDYPVLTSPDSSTYVQAAQDLLSGDFSVGLGRRTPGYPLLIAALDLSPKRVIAAQMVMGLAHAMVLFAITLALTGNRALAFAVGLLHHMNLQQLFQENILLTEAMSAFTVTVALAAWLVVLRRLGEGRTALPAAIVASVLAWLAAMVRPQFVFLPVLFGALTLFIAPLLASQGAVGSTARGRHALAAAWRALPAGRTWRIKLATVGLAMAIPALALVLAWCAVVQVKVGPFTMSTQSGFGFMNHFHDDIELAPERFAPLRQIIQETRDARIAEVGHARNTVWYAWPRVQRELGWTMPEASRQFQAVGRAMIAEHPWLYAKSVASAWVDFWTVPNFWAPDSIQPPPVRRAALGLWAVEHPLLRLANLVFVLLSAAVLLSARLRAALRWNTVLTAAVAAVWASSLIQAMADQGASSRYLLPTQSLIVLVVLVAAWRIRSSRIAPSQSR